MRRGELAEMRARLVSVRSGGRHDGSADRWRRDAWGRWCGRLGLACRLSRAREGDERRSRLGRLSGTLLVGRCRMWALLVRIRLRRVLEVRGLRVWGLL